MGFGCLLLWRAMDLHGRWVHYCRWQSSCANFQARQANLPSPWCKRAASTAFLASWTSNAPWRMKVSQLRTITASPLLMALTMMPIRSSRSSSRLDKVAVLGQPRPTMTSWEINSVLFAKVKILPHPQDFESTTQAPTIRWLAQKPELFW